MATDTKLDSLVINYLTQAQYDNAKSEGTLNSNQNQPAGSARSSIASAMPQPPVPSTKTFILQSPLSQTWFSCS